MQAIQLIKHGKAQEAFKLVELEDPTPAPDEVLIDVAYSGINFAEVMARQGLYEAAPNPPSILGYEVAGTISAIGNQVKHLAVGQKVVALTRFGGYASKAVAKELACTAIPNNLPLADALALATQAVTACIGAKYLANIQAHDTVLVRSAAGGVGLFLCQMAKNAGAKVIAVCSNKENGAWLVAHSWADKAIDYADTAGYKNQASVIFNAAGGKTVKEDLSLLKAGGRLVIFGASTRLSKKANKLNGLRTLLSFGWINPLKLIMESKSIIGLNVLKVGDSNPVLLENAIKTTHTAYQSGDLKVHIHKEYAPNQMGKAHQDIEKRITKGKLVISWAH